MTLYAYRCADCGLEQDFDFAMGSAPTTYTSEASHGIHQRQARDCVSATGITRLHVFQRVITVPIIQGDTVAGGVAGGSKDGYVLDSRTGWTSRKGLKLDEKDRKSRAPK